MDAFHLSPPDHQRRTHVNWSRAAFRFCAALAVAHVVAFLCVALLRWRYPYDLEWMEGGQLVQSYEILAGRFPYRAPSADYIAFPYQPLYAAVVAALGWIFGLSLPLARAVSIASTLACAGLVGRAVWRETGDRAYGLLAAATVLALYRVVGFWFDLARVDSLFMALLVGALYAGRYVEGAWRSCLTSAALFVLAYKTKQLALPFCVLVPPLLSARSRRAAWAFIPLVLLPLAVDFWLSQRASDGWFSFYVNQVPRAQPYQLSRVIRFPWIVAVQIPVLVGLAAADAARNVRRRPWRAHLSDVWTLATIVGAAVAVAAWARPGGYANNMMTMYIFAVIPGFVALHRMAGERDEPWTGDPLRCARDAALVAPIRSDETNSRPRGLRSGGALRRRDPGRRRPGAHAAAALDRDPRGKGALLSRERVLGERLHASHGSSSGRLAAPAR